MSTDEQSKTDDGQSRLTVELGMTVDEARINAGDARRYGWFVQYLIGPRYDLDDSIVAAKTKEEFDSIMDSDMMGSTCDLPHLE